MVITWERPTQQACLSKYVKSNRIERKASFTLVLVGGYGVCVWGVIIYVITENRYDFDPVQKQSSFTVNLEMEMAVIVLVT